MRAQTILGLLGIAVLTLALTAAGCHRKRSASDAELDELADAADEVVAALRTDAPREWSLLAVMEQRTLIPSTPTPVETTGRRVAAVERLQGLLARFWARLGTTQMFVPDLADYDRWIHSPAGYTRAELAALVARLEQVDTALAGARRAAKLPPRRLALGGDGPAPVPRGTVLPALPPGVGSAGVRMWPLVEAVVILQYGSDPAVCPSKEVSCLHRQAAWLGEDGRLIDAQPLERSPRADEAWHVVAGGTDALFAAAIAKDGSARVDVYRPGRKPQTAAARLDYGARVSADARGMVAGSAIVTVDGLVATGAAGPAQPVGITQFLKRGRGSRDWFSLEPEPVPVVGRVEQDGAVLAFVRRHGDRRTAVRLADLPGKASQNGERRITGVPLQLVSGSGAIAVAIALPPDRLVVLLSRDGGQTWVGAGQ